MKKPKAPPQKTIAELELEADKAQMQFLKEHVALAWSWLSRLEDTDDVRVLRQMMRTMPQPHALDRLRQCLNSHPLPYDHNTLMRAAGLGPRED